MLGSEEGVENGAEGDGSGLGCHDGKALRAEIMLCKKIMRRTINPS